MRGNELLLRPFVKNIGTEEGTKLHMHIYPPPPITASLYYKPMKRNNEAHMVILVFIDLSDPKMGAYSHMTECTEDFEGMVAI